MENVKPCVLQTFDPSLGRRVQVGKVVYLDGKGWVYRVDPPSHGRMRLLDAWGIYPCVLAYLEDAGVSLIHLHEKASCYVLETTTHEAKRYGILSAHGKRSIHQYHVPLAYWRKLQEYHAPWVNEVVTLPWLDVKPEPKPQQAAMF